MAEDTQAPTDPHFLAAQRLAKQIVWRTRMGADPGTKTIAKFPVVYDGEDYMVFVRPKMDDDE